MQALHVNLHLNHYNMKYLTFFPYKSFVWDVLGIHFYMILFS